MVRRTGERPLYLRVYAPSTTTSVYLSAGALDALGHPASVGVHLEGPDALILAPDGALRVIYTDKGTGRGGSVSMAPILRAGILRRGPTGADYPAEVVGDCRLRVRLPYRVGDPAAPSAGASLRSTALGPPIPAPPAPAPAGVADRALAALEAARAELCRRSVLLAGREEQSRLAEALRALGRQAEKYQSALLLLEEFTDE